MILPIVRNLCLLVKLSKIQQQLISEISQTNKNTTQFAVFFSKEHNTPLSTIWFNLRKLRDSELVKFNSQIILTQLGKLLSSSGSSMVEQAVVARKVGSSNLSLRTSLTKMQQFKLAIRKNDEIMGEILNKRTE